ncbi:thiol reductant ABC exporter subunit CydD [Devosia sp.]|uniref:thiol reductant ABC exporter subunit CydD n=1 Tax=Devosia sp. TaxID=1871048 RepID=UPI003A945DF7
MRRETHTTAVPPDDAKAVSQALRQVTRLGGWHGRLAIALPLLASAMLLLQAWVLADILDRAIVAHEALTSLLPAVAVLMGLIAVRIGLISAGEIFSVGAGEAAKRRLRGGLARNLIAHRPTWTAARSSGGLAGLGVEQIEALDGYLVRYVPAMAQAAIVPLAFALVILPIDWMVGLIFLISAPLIPLFMALVGWGAEAASRAQAEALSRLGGRFADRLRGMVTLKLFGRADAEVESIRSASEELRGRTMKVMRIAFLSSAVLEFFAAIGVAGVALYVGLTFLDLVSLRGTELTLAAGLFCLLMAPEVYQPLRLMAAHYHDRGAARAALAELTAACETLPLDATATAEAEPMRSGDAVPLGVALAAVHVATPTGRPVITGANLKLVPGERMALIGPSGCGKSTLIEAIARLRDITGTILVGDSPLESWTEAALRNEIGMISQRPHVFAGTIADNIRLGRSDACDTAVQLAAHRAAVTNFANGLPDGLDTAIGENGLGLSGGEVQRIALARLYLREPGLILLDEPTAHLDAATEQLVLDGLLDFARGRSLIIATHSPAVAARMDRVYRVAGGTLHPALVPQMQRQQIDRGAA